MEPVLRVIQKFPLEALFVGFSPVGKHTMLTVAHAVGPQRIGVDNALAAARSRTSQGIEKSRKVDRTVLKPSVNLNPRLALSKKAKSAAAQRASTRKFQSSLSDITKRAQKLRTAAGEIRSNTEVFQGREVKASNEKMVTVKVDSGQSMGTFALKVDQVAKAQENRGLALARTSANALDSGRQFFEVKMGGEARRLSVTVAPGERGDLSLQKVAASVNNSGFALDANVMLEGDGEAVSLTLSATQTGEAAAFSVRDVAGSVVAKSGIDKLALPAQNAVFLLNGNKTESQVNEFVVDAGSISMTLQEPGSTEISVFRNQAPLLGAMDNLVGEINQFREALGRAKDTINEDIAVEFDRHLEELALELESMGVAAELGTPGSDGAGLRLDAETLGQVAETQPIELEQALAGTEGLAGRMEGFAHVVEQASAMELVALSETEMVESVSSDTHDTGSSGGVVNDSV